MTRHVVALGLALATTAGLAVLAAGAGLQAPRGAILLDGARLVAGDGSPPVEHAALAIENGRVVAVGLAGRIVVPPGARRIDLTGKTIVPALVDGHVHLGYQVGLSFSADNYTRATLTDQLNRYAYAGVGAVLSMGTDPGEMPVQLRIDQAAGRIGGARFLFAGRGLAAPNAGPGTPELKASAIGVETEAEAREAVRGEIARDVEVVKIWVDDRNGTVQKLAPPLYRAIIDEAHKHRARVVAHVFYLDDAKDLVRAGVDAFAHLVRDKEIDDELIALLKTHRVLVMPNIAINENSVHASPPPWLDEPLARDVVPAAEIDRIRSAYATRTPESVERARRTYQMMQRSLAKLNAAGVTIGFGTDDGAVRDHPYAFTPHRELRLMAAAGMTPLQVITAATHTTATFLGLTDRGVLRSGMRADFVVFDANPLDDLANTTKIAQVWLGGEMLDRAALRAGFK
jgi:imidazolonepropionase-like amidohydrolase